MRRIAALAFLAAASSAGCDDMRGRAPGTPAGVLPAAACDPADAVETGVQGQIPFPLRSAGAFAGFQCNLHIAARIRGEGAGWQHVFFADASGHRCSYYDTAATAENRLHQGVVVVDATDVDHPVVTTYLVSPAMLDPLESLRVNDRRGLLAAARDLSAANGPEVELYDLSGDCRFPRLLSPPLQPASDAAAANGAARGNDTAAANGAPAGVAVTRGDEGNFAPDGLTYYATHLRSGTIVAVDVSDPAKPRRLAQWSMPSNQRTSGLSLNAEGTRIYLTLYGRGLASPAGSAEGLDNGIVIADVTEVQARRPRPRILPVATLLWGDGSAAHETLPVTIGGRRYLVVTDEGGAGDPNTPGWTAACNAGLPPWAMARLIDISDEAAPRLVARLSLAINDAGRCGKVIPDLAGLTGFTYGSHSCSVDRADDATTLACGWFESGVRVFDIRQPAQPREIAYFVPASVTVPSPGSLNNRRAANGRPDHCSAQVRLDPAAGALFTTCQDNGFLALRFERAAWPFDSGGAH